MIVFVVVPDYDFEGFGYPEAAFLSKNEAEEFISRIKQSSAHREIVELEIGKAD